MIAIVDYGLGNLRSVFGAVTKLGYDAKITRDLTELKQARKIIIPGVGAFGDGISNIKKLGLFEELTKLVIEDKKPVLGICLGAQLLAKDSTELGYNEGLGWIDASVVKLSGAHGVRIPHVGWNALTQVKPSLLFNDIPHTALFYYVHSFHIKCNNPGIVAGISDHGEDFVAVIEHDNIFATQFHPEKSQEFGLKLLNNFLSLS